MGYLLYNTITNIILALANLLIILYILVSIYPAGVSDTLEVLLGYRTQCYKYKAVCNPPELYKQFFR